MIGTQRTLGVGPPASALLYVIASPVGPYYPTGFKAVSLEATDYAVRAWPGGVGDKKLGANYAPCIVPQMQAASRGFHQNLWLFGEEEYVTEVGTMNLFAAIKNKETGQPELLTAPLDGTILEGVTRDSILGLARERLEPKGWKVLEKKFTMKELADAADEGRMMEIFGAGTAAIVSPVRKISWKGRLVDCGLEDHVEAGPIALQMKEWMEAIQYGDEDHPWRYDHPMHVRLCTANSATATRSFKRHDCLHPQVVIRRPSPNVALIFHDLDYMAKGGRVCIVYTAWRAAYGRRHLQPCDCFGHICIQSRAFKCSQYGSPMASNQ